MIFALKISGKLAYPITGSTTKASSAGIFSWAAFSWAAFSWAAPSWAAPSWAALVGGSRGRLSWAALVGGSRGRYRNFAGASLAGVRWFRDRRRFVGRLLARGPDWLPRRSEDVSGRTSHALARGSKVKRDLHPLYLVTGGGGRSAHVSLQPTLARGSRAIT
jgi:hypothetical protein